MNADPGVASRPSPPKGPEQGLPALNGSAGFREAMRGLASAVTLLTACDADGMPHGMAATAVIPVSMDPPSMLIAVNRSASLHPVIEATGRFCVNVLPDSQRDIVEAFSRSDMRSRRFTDFPWSLTEEGLPCLPQAQSVITCRCDERLAYGTHTLYIGRVERVGLGELAPPLVWFDGGPLQRST